MMSIVSSDKGASLQNQFLNFRSFLISQLGIRDCDSVIIKSANLISKKVFLKSISLIILNVKCLFYVLTMCLLLLDQIIHSDLVPNFSFSYFNFPINVKNSVCIKDTG